MLLVIAFRIKVHIFIYFNIKEGKFMSYKRECGRGIVAFKNDFLKK